MDTSLRLSERTALITAGCSSLGRAMAFRLSELGAHVAIVDDKGKGGDRIAEEVLNLREVHEKRGRAAFFETNYSDPKAMIDTVGKAAERFGGLDILIDAQLLDCPKNFQLAEGEDFDVYLNRNIKTSLLLPEKACEIFKVRKKGRIIFLANEMELARRNNTGPSRQGLLKFIKGLGREFLQEQVTVNAVSVGPTEEYLLQKVPDAKSIQAAHQSLYQSQPEIRMTLPEDLANLVAFLASPLASGVTGQCISASGTLSLLAPPV